ncbi:hypothetical protein HAX54_008687 [Datura stramonium]|uniref:Uncharacterized protein n=1 Tax=Datura stramonium TaxID=4076 RepID=A0ABS8TDM8_DATST|nr:hypothetical protein [Datura stramonium]
MGSPKGDLAKSSSNFLNFCKTRPHEIETGGVEEGELYLGRGGIPPEASKASDCVFIPAYSMSLRLSLAWEVSAWLDSSVAPLAILSPDTLIHHHGNYLGLVAQNEIHKIFAKAYRKQFPTCSGHQLSLATFSQPTLS